MCTPSEEAEPRPHNHTENEVSVKKGCGPIYASSRHSELRTTNTACGLLAVQREREGKREEASRRCYLVLPLMRFVSAVSHHFHRDCSTQTSSRPLCSSRSFIAANIFFFFFQRREEGTHMLHRAENSSSPFLRRAATSVLSATPQRELSSSLSFLSNKRKEAQTPPNSERMVFHRIPISFIILSDLGNRRVI